MSTDPTELPVLHLDGLLFTDTGEKGEEYRANRFEYLNFVVEKRTDLEEKEKEKIKGQLKFLEWNAYFLLSKPEMYMALFLQVFKSLGTAKKTLHIQAVKGKIVHGYSKGLTLEELKEKCTNKCTFREYFAEHKLVPDKLTEEEKKKLEVEHSLEGMSWFIVPYALIIQDGESVEMPDFSKDIKDLVVIFASVYLACSGDLEENMDKILSFASTKLVELAKKGEVLEYEA